MTTKDGGGGFRERYAVHRLRDGGLIVDLVTGTYSRLNASAAEICAVLLEAPDAAASVLRVAQLFACSDDVARSAIADVLAGLARRGPRREPLGSYRYLRDPTGGYLLTSSGRPRIAIDADGAHVRLAAPDDDSTSLEQIFAYLRAVAPKALFLQSTLVMHGAANRTRQGVRVISGVSGAGKTTTARAFAASGAELFAEDMLVVASLSPASIFSTGEKTIDDWAEQSAATLIRDRRRQIATSMLGPTNRGAPTPIEEIWFIDGGRRLREAPVLSPRKLGETDGALAIMTSLFLGGASNDAWREFLTIAGALASSVPVFETLMPDGIDRLEAAARRYTESSAS
ncbi:MAG TPA: PqqD family protein [Polyangia bacterium]|nr:PqqD family protein [Polyangia bacterium]